MEQLPGSLWGSGYKAEPAVLLGMVETVRADWQGILQAQRWLCCFEVSDTGGSNVGSDPHFGLDGMHLLCVSRKQTSAC